MENRNLPKMLPHQAHWTLPLLAPLTSSPNSLPHQFSWPAKHLHTQRFPPGPYEEKLAAPKKAYQSSQNCPEFSFHARTSLLGCSHWNSLRYPFVFVVARSRKGPIYRPLRRSISRCLRTPQNMKLRVCLLFVLSVVCILSIPDSWQEILPQPVHSQLPLHPNSPRIQQSQLTHLHIPNIPLTPIPHFNKEQRINTKSIKSLLKLHLVNWLHQHCVDPRANLPFHKLQWWNSPSHRQPSVKRFAATDDDKEYEEAWKKSQQSIKLGRVILARQMKAC